MKKGVSKDLIIDVETTGLQTVDPQDEFRRIPHAYEPPAPLKVGDIVHVRVAHNSTGTKCHAALITDITRGNYNAWVYPCGACPGTAQRISLKDVQWHRLEDCK